MSRLGESNEHEKVGPLERREEIRAAIHDALDKNERLGFNELLDMTGAYRATLSNHLKALMLKGLVTREIDMGDLRRSYYSHTKRGEELVNRHHWLREIERIFESADIPESPGDLATEREDNWGWLWEIVAGLPETFAGMDRAKPAQELMNVLVDLGLTQDEADSLWNVLTLRAALPRIQRKLEETIKHKLSEYGRKRRAS